MDADQIYKNLGRRIKTLRKEGLRLTQEQLAKRVGISRASLANIEAGRQQVLVHHLFALASALDLDSPVQLLLSSSGQARPEGATSNLPLAGEGLTEKQRREVLNLMGGVLENNNLNTGKEDA
jgi:transcriptional regulator with XRE-family HTH domain